jgi:acetoin utilization deacetylase AcuC-like enzyme
MIIFHGKYLDHMQSDMFHPESPDRLKGILAELFEHEMKKVIQEPEDSGEDVLALVHESSYIDAIKHFGQGFYDGDTYVRPETYGIALMSAWGGITAADLAFKGEPSFGLLRPPGHHAGIDFAGGFCYFNNIAIAAEHSIKKHGIKRCAIVDIDVHHGNGTENIFRARNDVLYISTHQQGIYPGTGYVDYTGEKEGTGYTVNIPLTSGSGDSTFDSANKKVILPILGKFKPELLLVSFGGDAHYRDPIASLSLSSLGYVKICEDLISFAEKGKIPIAFTLEGGYDVPALSECVRAVCQRLHGQKVDKLKFIEISDTMNRGLSNVERAFDVHKAFWEL